MKTLETNIRRSYRCLRSSKISPTSLEDTYHITEAEVTLAMRSEGPDEITAGMQAVITDKTERTL